MKDAKDAPLQRPEDFMDEEDLREAEEAKALSTSDGFAGFGTTQEDVLRTGGLMDILRVTGDTMGTKLLKKMGWKEGQGVGPRVRRTARLDHGEDISNDTHLFAPDDAQMISFVRKTDQKGLGYEGEARLPSSRDGARESPLGTSDYGNADVGSARGLTKNHTKSQGKKAGFGVGILNDTGSDDEDPYEMGPKISYSKVLGGNKKTEKKKKSMLSSANPLLSARPVFLSKKTNGLKLNSGFRKCHDGRLPLDGFVLSSELDAFASISLRDDKYKLPEVPADWKSSKTQHGQAESQYLSTAEATKASSLDAHSRSKLLGEEQLPGKSVFDFMSQSARAKIAAASGKSNLPAAGGESAPKGYEISVEERSRNQKELIPYLDANVALQALARGNGGWMPYSEDHGKRSRYREYLETQAGTRNELPAKEEGVSKDEWIFEMQEFARAAEVFKPVNSLMASRFTSASSQPAGGSETFDSTNSSDSLLTKPTPKPEDHAEAAAKLGMFGPLTRSVQSFYPTRLLCKRFNVKPPAIVQPEPGDGPSDDHTSRTPRDSSRLLMLESTVPRSQESIHPIGGSGESARQPVIDTERNEALEVERPGQAVFKAIFGSDDEDE